MAEPILTDTRTATHLYLSGFQSGIISALVTFGDMPPAEAEEIAKGFVQRAAIEPLTIRAWRKEVNDILAGRERAVAAGHWVFPAGGD